MTLRQKSCATYIPTVVFFPIFRMGGIAGSISGVEKQLEEQTALHLEFEQRKVRMEEGEISV